MSDMVRKQIYINRRQEALLKRLSKLRGISEAEIIRRAIDRETAQGHPLASSMDRSAWEEILKFVEERLKMEKTGESLIWDRQEIYAERENRLFPDPSQKEE